MKKLFKIVNSNNKENYFVIDKITNFRVRDCKYGTERPYVLYIDNVIIDYDSKEDRDNALKELISCFEKDEQSITHRPLTTPSLDKDEVDDYTKCIEDCIVSSEPEQTEVSRESEDIILDSNGKLWSLKCPKCGADDLQIQECWTTKEEHQLGKWLTPHKIEVVHQRYICSKCGHVWEERF